MIKQIAVILRDAVIVMASFFIVKERYKKREPKLSFEYIPNVYAQIGIPNAIKVNAT